MPHDDIGFVLRFACLSVLPQLQHLQHRRPKIFEVLRPTLRRQ